jgi:GDP-L-fucose synthase
MNTLITGGYGLLGSSLNFGIKPKKEELDLLDYSKLCNFIENNKINSIIHAAARVGGVKSNTDYIFDFFSENTQMSLNVMNACKRYNIKKSIYIISTCAFPSESPLPLKEEYLHIGEPHFTNYGYAYSKRMLEVGSRSLRQQYGLNSFCLIPCNLYGENDSYNLKNGHVIPSLIHKCYLSKINNTPFEIWGTGNAEREFLYVEDFSNIIEKIYKNNIDIENTMIISPENIVSIREIVELIAKKIKFNGKIIFDKTKPEGILKKDSDNTKFKKYFPDFKFTPLEDGLEKTIEFFIKNYSTIRK